jgi:uncharacterized protein YutD
MKEILTNKALVAFLVVIGYDLAKKLLVYGSKKVDKFQQSKKMQKKEKLNKVIDQVQTFVTYAVTTVGDTYVNALKTNGLFTDEAKKEAEKQAIEIIKPFIGKQEMAILVTACKDLDEFLSKKIMETVDNKKVSTTVQTETQQSA